MPFYEEGGKIGIFVVALSFMFLKGDSYLARSKRIESGFQDQLIKTIKNMFPGCMVFKFDPAQGVPDILILYKDRWATLECKKETNAVRQANQEEFVDIMNWMSFSRFVFPENREEVLRDLQSAFQSKR